MKIGPHQSNQYIKTQSVQLSDTATNGFKPAQDKPEVRALEDQYRRDQFAANEAEIVFHNMSTSIKLLRLQNGNEADKSKDDPSKVKTVWESESGLMTRERTLQLGRPGDAEGVKSFNETTTDYDGDGKVLEVRIEDYKWTPDGQTLTSEWDTATPHRDDRKVVLEMGKNGVIFEDFSRSNKP